MRSITRYLLLTWLVSCPVFLAFAQPVSAQTKPASTIDDLMTAQNGQKSGALRHGELLVTALKREKIDGNSSRLAIQSLSKLLDFRLSRADDRYVYQINSSRQLLMLRYQRGSHVYEATRTEKGLYEAKLLDIQSAAAPAPQPPNHMDDGEIDVEQPIAADGIGLENSPQPDPAKDIAAQQLDSMDTANDSDPIQPTDPALADKPSPDSEFPENTGYQNSPDIAADNQNHGNEAPYDLDEPGPAPELLDKPVQEQPPNIVQPTSRSANEPIQTVQIRCRPEESRLFTPGLVMLIIGIGLFIFGLLTVIWPSFRAKRRLNENGLHICDRIFVSSSQQIACIEYRQTRYLVLINREKMQFIAPCLDDPTELFDELQAKTYWHEMAQHPISDRQLAALIKDFHHKKSVQ